MPYVKFREAKIAESEEVSPGIIIDYSEEGEIVGIEVIPELMCHKNAEGDDLD